MVGTATVGSGDRDGAHSGGGSRGGSLRIRGRGASEDGSKSLYRAGKRPERPERIGLAMEMVAALSGAAARGPCIRTLDDTLRRGSYISYRCISRLNHCVVIRGLLIYA